MVDHYEKRIKKLIHEYNRPFPGPYYFARFLRRKNEAKIADIGSGPICILGNLWSGVKLTIYASDINQPEYAKMLEEENCKLVTPVEYQDMESLTYPDEFFDVVHCANALDHTKDAQKALDEMKRVCKKGGYIYLRHLHNQKKVNGGRGHFWDAKKNGFFNGKSLVTLDGFLTADDGFFIVSIMKKE